MKESMRYEAPPDRGLGDCFGEGLAFESYKISINSSIQYNEYDENELLNNSGDIAVF
jgi:hypothetical protein